MRTNELERTLADQMRGALNLLIDARNIIADSEPRYPYPEVAEGWRNQVTLFDNAMLNLNRAATQTLARLDQ